MTNMRQTERRRHRRVRMKQTMRVRPTDPKDGIFEEIGTTKDVSQDGAYFLTKMDVYHEGMRLFFTLPYHAPRSQQNYEYLGQITRVDVMENGQKGVAVKFLASTNKKSF